MALGPLEHVRMRVDFEINLVELLNQSRAVFVAVVMLGTNSRLFGHYA
jgi:hypothetical protein